MLCSSIVVTLALLSADPTGAEDFIRTPWTCEESDGNLALVFLPSDVWHKGTAWIVGFTRRGYTFGKYYAAWKANYQVFTTDDPDVVLLRFNFTKHFVGTIETGGFNWRQDERWRQYGADHEIQISGGRLPQQKITLVAKRPYRFDDRGKATEYVKPHHFGHFVEPGASIKFTRKAIGEYPDLRKMKGDLPPGLELDDALFK